MAIKLTEGTVKALEALKQFEKEATLNDVRGIEEATASAHLTSLVRNGLAEVFDVEREIVEVRTFKAYKLTDAGLNFDPAKGE